MFFFPAWFIAVCAAGSWLGIVPLIACGGWRGSACVHPTGELVARRVVCMHRDYQV